MIDLELFRKNPKVFESEIKKRGLEIKTNIGLKLDEERRNLILEIDKLRSDKNTASKTIPALKGEERNKKINKHNYICKPFN